MKKYVWLLIAAAFAVAVLAMVGCRPAETPAESPSPTAPTPTADTACPKVVSVVVRQVYSDAYDEEKGAEFTVTLTFDEDIAGTWSCILDEDSWTVTVVNATRQDSAFADGKSFTPIKVEKIAKNKIKITAKVEEEDKDSDNIFYGLICDEEDAENYAKLFGIDDVPTLADTVKVELDDDCVIYDALGNPCCGLEASGCCSVVCEVTIPTGCPL